MFVFVFFVFLRYCLGGTGVLLYAMEGYDAAVALVSIHGGLTPEVLNTTVISAVSDATKVLVLSGGQDDTSSDIMTLENSLNNATADWEITRFSGIQHAWTVWMSRKY